MDATVIIIPAGQGSWEDTGLNGDGAISIRRIKIQLKQWLKEHPAEKAMVISAHTPEAEESAVLIIDGLGLTMAGEPWAYEELGTSSHSRTTPEALDEILAKQPAEAVVVIVIVHLAVANRFLARRGEYKVAHSQAAIIQGEAVTIIGRK